jgi:hypothetical protein
MAQLSDANGAIREITLLHPASTGREMSAGSTRFGAWLSFTVMVNEQLF